MKTTRNSDRLKDILLSTRHQIVALKDIQIDLLRHDSKVANQIATQISALEEVYKHQLTLVTLAEAIEPKKPGWFSGLVFGQPTTQTLFYKRNGVLIRAVQGEVQRAQSFFVLGCGVCTFIEQKFGGQRCAVMGGHHQGCGAVGRLGVNVGVHFQQKLHHLDMPLGRRIVQGRPACFVHVSALFDQ